jgi:hypothetical protein
MILQVPSPQTGLSMEESSFGTCQATSKGGIFHGDSGGSNVIYG